MSIPGKLLAEFGCVRIVQLGAAPGVLGVEMNTQSKGRNKMNLMNHHFFDSIQVAFDHISLNMGDEARCALLYSTPVGLAHFSAGLDIKSVAGEFFSDASYVDKAKIAATVAVKSNEVPSVKGPGFPAMKQMKLRQHIRRWQDACSSVARCRVPVIGVLNGYSYGGAVDLASACDFRIASQTVQLTVQEAKVGIVADLGTLQRLPTIVGQGVAREWAYTGRIVKHDEALRRGFVNEVLADDEKAVSHALGIATEIATQCSPFAVQGTKEVLNQESERKIQDGLDYVRTFNSAFLLNDDVVAASLNFMTKSKSSPKWKCRVYSDSSYSPTAAVKQHTFAQAQEPEEEHHQQQQKQEKAEGKSDEKK